MRAMRSTLGMFLAALLCGCGPRAEEEPAWVGCVASFSGADQSAGGRLKHGIELAVDDSASMRVEGRRLAVVLADDRGSEETAQAEAVRLLAVNRVAGLIGGADSERALRLARANQPYNAPLVLPCEVAGPLPGDAVFTLGVPPAWRGKALARFASNELKAKQAVLFIDGRNPIAVELAAAFVQEWPRDGGGSLQQQTYLTDAEIPDRISTVKIADDSAVFMIAAPAAGFGKVRRLLGRNGFAALYGGDDEDMDALSAVPGTLYTATVFAREALTERGQEFAKKYQERFHEAPALAAVQGYDAARLLFDAMARAKTVAADKVREQLTATSDFESLTGPLRIKDGRARRRVFLASVQDGTAKVVQRIDAETDDPPSGGR